MGLIQKEIDHMTLVDQTLLAKNEKNELIHVVNLCSENPLQCSYAHIAHNYAGHFATPNICVLEIVLAICHSSKKNNPDLKKWIKLQYQYWAIFQQCV